MELKQKSTEEIKWSVEDHFIENLQEEFKIGPTILSDISMISMDEYLDLRLLDCYIKNPEELG